MSQAQAQISDTMRTITHGRSHVDQIWEYDKRPYRFREFMEVETPGLDDALTTEDLMFLMPESLNREIITLAEEARIGRNFLDVIRISSESESFLKEYGFAAAEVPEGAEVPVGKPRYEKIHLLTFKVGVRPLLTYEAIADAKIAILQRNIRQATLAMSRFEDAHIMAVLNGGVPEGSSIVGTREADHSFAATGNALSWDNLVQCYTAITMEQLSPTDIIIHPYQMAQILKMEEFRQWVDVSAALTLTRGFQNWNPRIEAMYGNAKIGTLLGCTVWVTLNQTAGTLLMIDKNNYAILAERRPLLTESTDDIIHQMHTVVFTQRYCAGIINNDGAANVTALVTSMP